MFVPVSEPTDAFECQDDPELAAVLGRILFGVSEPTYRPERLVLAPDIAARLERDGQAIGRITHYEGGSAEIELVSTDDAEVIDEPDVDIVNADHARGCSCLDCKLDLRLYHSMTSVSGTCGCSSCTELADS